jgi:hypothetical protein
MLYFTFFLIELIAIGGFFTSRELLLSQFFIAFLIALKSSFNYDLRNVNSNIIMLFYCATVALLDNSMHTIGIEYKYIIILVFVWFMALQRYKTYDIKSDEYNPENIMLVFYKPHTARDYIISLFGMETGTMSMICDGKWAKFRWGYSYLKICELKKRRLNKNYIVIDTGVKVTEDIKHAFYSLKGAPARTAESLYFRFNCVRIFKPVFRLMGRKWQYHFLDCLPSVYLMRRKLI